MHTPRIPLLIAALVGGACALAQTKPNSPPVHTFPVIPAAERSASEIISGADVARSGILDANVGTSAGTDMVHKAVPIGHEKVLYSFQLHDDLRGP
jgi:hypothetical protein